jgi:Outer membrane receptor for Fe3+-dicitrate
MNKVSAIVAAAVLAGHCLCVQPGWAAETPPETGGQEAPASKADLTQGSLTAYDLPAVTTFGVADQAPTVPVQTRFGTQYNVVTEEQIRLQNSLDFYDALRNVPGVMYQKKNIIGGQTSASLYVRGRGAAIQALTSISFLMTCRAAACCTGRPWADGIPVYALGGMEIYKYPQAIALGTGMPC